MISEAVLKLTLHRIWGKKVHSLGRETHTQRKANETKQLGAGGLLLVERCFYLFLQQERCFNPFNVQEG